MTDIEVLSAQVADLASRISRQTIPANPETVVQPPSVVPYWDCTYCLGLTLTTGAALDWDPLFDDPSLSSWMKFQEPAGSGSFDKGNLGFGLQRRLVLTWDSPTARSVKCLLSGPDPANTADDANIQVKMNGVMTEYVAGSGPAGVVSQIITVDVKQGRNRIAISTDLNPYTVQFCGDLIGQGSTFVDPASFQGYLR